MLSKKLSNILKEIEFISNYYKFKNIIDKLSCNDNSSINSNLNNFDYNYNFDSSCKVIKEFNFIKFKNNLLCLHKIIKEYYFEYEISICNLIYNYFYYSEIYIVLNYLIKECYKCEVINLDYIKNIKNCKYKNKYVDCIILKPRIDNSFNKNNLDNSNEDTDCNGKLAIICNQNAVCYENLYFSNKNIEFLLNNNISVCLWNYKGFNTYSKNLPSFNVS